MCGVCVCVSSHNERAHQTLSIPSGVVSLHVTLRRVGAFPNIWTRRSQHLPGIGITSVRATSDSDWLTEHQLVVMCHMIGRRRNGGVTAWRFLRAHVYWLRQGLKGQMETLLILKSGEYA